RVGQPLLPQKSDFFSCLVNSSIKINEILLIIPHSLSKVNEFSEYFVSCLLKAGKLTFSEKKLLTRFNLKGIIIKVKAV
ncbi:hypothetical protein LAJ55_15525, partial [Streptococcus pneumoniae]|uniref:hypothetical protein n=1 Tax=Streptococcus pneumoniae TaxID=1313 RepID=UPI001CBD66FA